MCLAIPGRLRSIEPPDPGDGLGEGIARVGVVDFGGITRVVSLAFVPEAGIGDDLLVHAGVAIQRLDPEAGDAVRRLLDAGLDPAGDGTDDGSDGSSLA